MGGAGGFIMYVGVNQLLIIKFSVSWEGLVVHLRARAKTRCWSP